MEIPFYEKFRSGFESSKKRIAEAADFLGQIAFPKAQIEHAEEVFHEHHKKEEIEEAKLLANSVLRKLDMGESMDEFDALGNWTGNTWERFRQLPHSITHAQMGLDDEQVTRLENKRMQTDAAGRLLEY
jgi:hypothetical protein